MATPIMKTHVYHEDRVFFVSTVLRDYDTYGGMVEGEETLAWLLSGERLTEREQIYQGGGIQCHLEVCRRLATTGETQPYDDA